MTVGSRAETIGGAAPLCAALDKLAAGLDAATMHLGENDRRRATQHLHAAACRIPVLTGSLPAPFGISFADWYNTLKGMGRHLSGMYEWTSYGPVERKSLRDTKALLGFLEKAFPSVPGDDDYPPPGKWHAQDLSRAVRHMNRHMARAEDALPAEDWHSFKFGVLRIERMKERLYNGLPPLLGVSFSEWYELVSGIDIDLELARETASDTWCDAVAIVVDNARAKAKALRKKLQRSKR
jgi:hypothetical protein